MNPLRSVGGRLALALVVVVTCALAIVYLIVVPSYRNSLTNQELKSLETAMRAQVIPKFPIEPWAKQQFTQQLSPQVNARVVVFSLASDTPLLVTPFADSDIEASPADLVNEPVAFRAISRNTVARGTVRRGGQEYAEVAYPLGSYVVMLSASLHDQLQVVSVVRTRVLVAGALAVAFAVLLG